MSLYTYGLTAQDVISELPGVDSSEITATSVPVTTLDVENFISDGASRLNTVLDKYNIVPASNMDVETHGNLRASVKWFAVAAVAFNMGLEETYDRANLRWEKAYQEWSNRPEQLGATYVDTSSAPSVDDVDQQGPEDYNFITFDKVW